MQRVSRRWLRKIEIAVGVLEVVMKRGGADLGRMKRGIGLSGQMSSRLVKYNKRRRTEAYTSCCDNVLLAAYLWDAHPVDVPTARMESHDI